jgi:hypothetical protein
MWLTALHILQKDPIVTIILKISKAFPVGFIVKLSPYTHFAILTLFDIELCVCAGRRTPQCGGWLSYKVMWSLDIRRQSKTSSWVICIILLRCVISPPLFYNSLGCYFNLSLSWFVCIKFYFAKSNTILIELRKR